MSLRHLVLLGFVILLIGGFSLTVYGQTTDTYGGYTDSIRTTGGTIGGSTDSGDCDCYGYTAERCAGYRCQHPTRGWITYGFDVGPCKNRCCGDFAFTPVYVPAEVTATGGCCPGYDCPMTPPDSTPSSDGSNLVNVDSGESHEHPGSDDSGMDTDDWDWNWDGMPGFYDDWTDMGMDSSGFEGFDSGYWDDWNSGGMYDGMDQDWTFLDGDSDYGYMNYDDSGFSGSDFPMFYSETDKSVSGEDAENLTPPIAPLIAYLPNGTPAYLTEIGDISTSCPEGYFCAYSIDPDPRGKGIIFMEPLNWILYPFSFENLEPAGNET